MIYRGRLSCGRMIRLHAHPLPLMSKFVSLTQSSCVSPVKLTSGREGGRGGAKLCVCEEAWLSINQYSMEMCRDLIYRMQAVLGGDCLALYK
jgi:hypothetical protein